jgi:hypothetical protein
MGLVVVVLGALLMVGGGLGLGRLPGDFAFKRGNVRVFFPLGTCLLLSLLLTLVLSVVGRR